MTDDQSPPDNVEIVDTGSAGRGPVAEGTSGGTAGGDPLDGVRASPEDIEEAVSGDTGPEHRGQR